MLRQQINGYTAYTISSEDATSHATFIPEKGGIGCSIVMKGKSGSRELLYLHDYFWQKNLKDLSGGFPFCFPVCARLERQEKQGIYLYEGKIYQLPIHGFAPYMPWEVHDFYKENLILTLRFNRETFLHYPFRFEIKLHYAISPDTLKCRQTYRNLGDHPMPYYAGFHPYFATPNPDEGKEKVFLEYSPMKRFQYNDTFTDLIGEKPLFNLPTSVTNPEINEQLTKVADDKLITLSYPNGDAIKMIAEGSEDPDLFPYIQLYTMKDKPFICVEPWMAFPNAMNTVSGVRWLQPGESEYGELTLWISDD